MKTTLTSIILFCSFALAAFGDQPLSKERQQQIFNGIDVNHDGAINFEEFKVAMTGNISSARMENVFQEKDRNHDGSLNNIEELYYIVRDQRIAQPETKAPAKK